MQGDNAQAAVSTDQLIAAAEVTNAANDTTMLTPMVAAAEANLVAVGGHPAETLVDDAGYWSAENLATSTTAELLITPMPTTKGPEHDDPSTTTSVSTVRGVRTRH